MMWLLSSAPKYIAPHAQYGVRIDFGLMLYARLDDTLNEACSISNS